MELRNPGGEPKIGPISQKKKYAERLRHPKWQRRRLEVMRRDGFRCLQCGDEESELHVHHKSYISGRMPWDYPLGNFETLCWRCHDLVLKDVQTLQAQLLDEIAELGLPQDPAKLAGCMMVRSSRLFVDRVVRFVEMFWTVFDCDWEMTSLTLGVSVCQRGTDSLAIALPLSGPKSPMRWIIGQIEAHCSKRTVTWLQ